MKILLIASLFTSLNAFSAQTCDLTVNIPQTEGSKIEIITGDASASVRSDEDNEGYQNSLLATEAIKECQSKGGTDCVVKTTKNYLTSSGGTFTNRRYTHHYNVHAEGKKISGGKKISDAQYAKKRIQAICQKIDVCINNAINDSDSSLQYMEKLSLAKNMNRCNEIENVIFEK
jgi:hypothetical protein